MSDDDEITTDVDPAWIAALRAEAAAGGGSPGDDTGAARSGAGAIDDADWFDDGDVRPADATAGDDATDFGATGFEAEATVGASSELLDRIRAEMSAGRTDAPAAPAPSPPAEPPVESREVPPPLPPPIMSQPPLAAAAPPEPVDDQVSTTVRWEPRQRLSGSTHVADAPLALADHRHHGIDRTKIAIALIIAVTVIVLAWLLFRDDGGGGPAPIPVDSVPTATVAGDSTIEGGGG